MKLLHTSDWHVGRLLRGASRVDEHVAVLAEIATIAESEAVDVVLVAGDLFDSAAPTAESEQVVYRALLDLEATGAHVVVLAGNHDHERRLQAVAPLLARGAVHVRAGFALPAEGGVIELPSRDGREVAQVACLPFLSQRTAIRAAELMATPAEQLGGLYRATMRHALELLTAPFRADAVKVVAAHLFADGSLAGGSERTAHLADGYAVPPDVFPPSAHYVALGHLHRAQAVGGVERIRYAGAPLQLDFGEVGHACSVTLVEATAATPAKVREVPLTTGRRLVQLEGTLAEVAARADDVGDAYVKVVLREQATVGLADRCRALFEACVDVVVRAPAAGSGAAPAVPSRAGRSPEQLLASYLEERGAVDERVQALFAQLVEEVTTGAP